MRHYSVRESIPTPARAALGGLVCIALLTGGCVADAGGEREPASLIDEEGIGAEGTSAGPVITSLVQAPPANGQFDYQIGGAYAPLAGVQIVDRDSSDPAVPGKYNICYINAFQTQPDATAWWKANHDNLLLKDGSGKYVVDSDWGEILFDTRTSAKRSALAAIQGGWIDACKAAGYQAIEPDNLDSYSRSKGLITKANNIAFATLLAQKAHGVGLAIAQKNASEIADAGKNQVGFDFVIAEECQQYSGSFGATECDDYIHYYGNQVFEIEYNDNGGLSGFNAACAARGASISIIYRDRDVVPKGTSGYVYQSC